MNDFHSDDSAQPFADLLQANQARATQYGLDVPDGHARRGVAIVTCMDPRIDPLAVFDLQVGDAYILRNPAGQVTDGVLRALEIATNLKGVHRVIIMPHTQCAANTTEHTMRELLDAARGTTTEWDTFGTVPDQLPRLRADVQAVRDNPRIPDTVAVGGFVFDLQTGLVGQEF